MHIFGMNTAASVSGASLCYLNQNGLITNIVVNIVVKVKVLCKSYEVSMKYLLNVYVYDNKDTQMVG